MALVGAALLCIFGSKKMDWTGAGPLAVLTLAFVAACQWRTEYSTGCDVSGFVLTVYDCYACRDKISECSLLAK